MLILRGRRWEDVDHDLDESLAGELTKAGPGGEPAEVADPLGLEGRVECVERPRTAPYHHAQSHTARRTWRWSRVRYASDVCQSGSDVSVQRRPSLYRPRTSTQRRSSRRCTRTQRTKTSALVYHTSNGRLTRARRRSGCLSRRTLIASSLSRLLRMVSLMCLLQRPSAYCT
jgi:hypothetical protein